MRIDGGTKASAGQQAESRFEQVMARELSRTSSGKTPTESNTQMTTAANGKKKSVPESQRVGVKFQAPQAGKVLKGMQDSVRQTLSKTANVLTETSKAALATLGKLGDAVDGVITKAVGKDGMIAKAFGKDGSAGTALGREGAAGKAEGAGTAKLSGDTPAAQTRTPATGPQTGTTPSAPTTPGTASQTAIPTAPRAEGAPVGAGTERGAGTPALAEAGAATTTTTGTTVEGPGAQEGRAALALLETPTTQEAFLMLNPGLQGIARKAQANGATLSMVYMLGPNVHGAEFVSITTDDTGFITGPDIDIALSDGALDTQGNWVARGGAGMLGGTKVALEPDGDGCAFVTDGVDGVPDSITAWLKGGDAIHAGILSVRNLE